MKKISFVTLFFILLLILFLDWFNHTSYKALSVSDDCKIGIDINDNSNISEDEYFSLNNIKTFCSPENLSLLENKIGKLSENEKIYFSLKTQDLYKKTFLTSLIRIDNGNISTNFHDPNIIFLKKGLALSDNPKYNSFENLEEIKKLKADAKNKTFVILNTKNLKYHKIGCENGENSKQKIYVLLQNLPPKAKPCKLCFAERKNSFDKNSVTPKFSKVIEIADTNGAVKIYQTIGAGTTKPSSKCTTGMCKSLKNEINSAKSTIDMATYDFLNQPELLKALQQAKSRGVKIRVVIDNKNLNENIYAKNSLKSFASEIYDDSTNKKDAFRLMHNKFLIFDKQKVWTGTANITDTCLSGFNANTTIIINSKEIANIYEQEFNNFLNGKFHSSKSKVETKEVSIGNGTITPYFSPKDKVISSQIIPEIKKAKKYIYVPSFITTHTAFANELINAKKRGIDVKLITDATSARNKYSVHTLLRKNNIPVKTENFAGKMHMKAVIIDDEIAFVGSMNLTKSGNVYNDENCLKIKDKQLVSDLKSGFLKIWKAIPNKYLTVDPRAESLESVGSCFDGIDNDYDGYIDGKDKGCQIKDKK